ncbi:YolD-like family protein [Bacillus altitudinis]|uniref:YolD-like family protein n=2 Tax=Bacillaceae TaxID=186817 RepID=A0ABV1SAL1_BACAB|nr:YolD-like family protein [Bacillus altitudinis]NOL32696.1 YolD-like family protein [Bacillus altitudinis]
MLRDRSTIKWTAMMLPEHVARLKHDLAETKKIDKPIIDEQQAEEFEATIAYAMSVNKPLNFSIFDLGVIDQLKQLLFQLSVVWSVRLNSNYHLISIQNISP